MEDGIIPVQLEIKKKKDNENRLSVVVALAEIESADVFGIGTDRNLPRNMLSADEISIASIIENVKEEDGDFLKYAPDQFLNSNQIEAKRKALDAEKSKIDDLRRGIRRSQRDSSDDMQHVKEAEEFFGKTYRYNEAGYFLLSFNYTRQKR